jgi:hypothetical protein
LGLQRRGCSDAAENVASAQGQATLQAQYSFKTLVAANRVKRIRVREVVIILSVSVFHIEQNWSKHVLYEMIFDRVIDAVMTNWV